MSQVAFDPAVDLARIAELAKEYDLGPFRKIEWTRQWVLAWVGLPPHAVERLVEEQGVLWTRDDAGNITRSTPTIH